MATNLTVTVDDVLAARKLLAEIVRTTPLAWSRPLSERFGGEVWFKCENLQRAGSFKIRGAYVRIHNLPRRGCTSLGSFSSRFTEIVGEDAERVPQPGARPETAMPPCVGKGGPGRPGARRAGIVEAAPGSAA